MSNIYWATPLQNAADKQRHGTTSRGDKHAASVKNVMTGVDHWSKRKPERLARGSAVNNAKLSEEQVQEIKSTPRYIGITLDLARKYGVADCTIGKILNGKTWRHVDAR